MHFDCQAAFWADGDFLSSSGSYFSRPGATSSSVRLFPVVVVEVIFGLSLVSLGCWQSQPIQLCRHPVDFKSGRFLVGPLKMWCSVQPMTEFQCLFLTTGDFLLGLAFKLG